jgi:CRISPR-associated protein Csb1
MIEGLEAEPRLIVEARLSPAVGSAIQPTGFPDLGPAEFERPLLDGTTQTALLVESVQSVANHLEGVCWDRDGDRPVATIAKLPYIEVRDDDDRFVTSSRLEPHRLAGAYVKNARLDDRSVGEWMVEQLDVEAGMPLDWRSIYAALLQLDPLCLLHGVFFSDPQWKNFGNPKVRRAVTGVIEAHDVKPVVSGGVKRDDVNPTVQEGKAAREGYGFVPFGRTQYTAAEIVLTIAIDIEQIRGYGLGDEATDLLAAIAMWEVRTLLDRPLRLRTSCDLLVDDVKVRRPDAWSLPSAGELAQRIEGSSVVFETDEPRTGRLA